MFQVYKDRVGEWRWSLVAGSNGRLIADSGEGYRRRNECQRAIERVKALAPIANVVELLEFRAGNEGKDQ